MAIWMNEATDVSQSTNCFFFWYFQLEMGFYILYDKHVNRD